jgi:CSLREA domain-containing protein
MTVAADSKFPGLAPTCGVTRVLCIALTLCLTTTAYSAAPSLKAVNTASRQLQLGTSYDLGYSLSKSAGSAKALGLAHGDFNTDGFQDLVTGYATDAGGMVTLHRGNEQAYAPSTATALADVKHGVFPPGFVEQSSLYSVPVAPDLMAAGDFNRDGDMDLLVAKRGDAAMYFLSGSRSGFGASQKFALAGAVDALVAGQIDMPDGMADFAVAISGTSGAFLLVYKELAGINGKAHSYKLPAAAAALEVGNLDDSPMGDIAILVNGNALVLHGHDQSAKVTINNRLQPLDFEFPVVAFALGDFIWDRANRTEFALLKADGSVHFAARGSLNTTAFSVAEARALRRQQAAVKSVTLKSWEPEQGGAWNIVESTKPQLSKGIAARGAKLFSARLSGNASDDLVIVDALTMSLQILSKSGDTRSVSKVAATSAPVAAIAMQTSSFVLNSLISLGAGAQAASVLPSAPLATFTVSKTADTNDGTCNADCSLREAIGAANALAGADSIVLPAGTFQLTIANAGGLNDDTNAQGDLDVNGALTITGAGAGTTIVSAGTTNANGIDKVFAFNPICVSPMATSISGITVSFGRNTQPTSAPDFSYTGGGIDWCGTGNSSMTVTNAIVANNTNTLAYGGGINLDSFAANGSVVITGTTISGNRTLSTLGNNTGGGVNLFADQHGVTITNCNITGNTAAGEGAGLFVRHTNGGAVLVQGTNFSNNIASSRGGGISNANLGASTFTINQDSTVVNNISQGLAGLAAEGGGIYSSANATTTINEVTITSNHANGAGAPEQRGGGGIATGGGTVNVTFNRIAGNTALGLAGSGIHKDLNPGTTTATNNWWGCNAGAAVAPCDRAVSAGGAGVTLTSTPHLVLNHAASPSTIVVGQTSALTADFLTNSASTAIAVANLDAIIGTTHAHNNPVRGTLSGTQISIQAAGNATATFTANAAGAGSADSVVDSQTRTVAITINKANTTTAITGDTPDPSVIGQIYAVSFSVSVTAPGSATPTAPTGNVTVSDGTNSCTAAVSAGTCNLPSTSPGAKTLTASYAGDANFNASVSATAAHTVNIASTITTISSDTPDPSNVGQAVTVNFAVAVVAPGAGFPTGNVTITAAGGAETCTAPVAAGTCMITLTAGGARDLTATYAGATNFNGSASAPASHTVTIPQVITLAFNAATSSNNENTGLGNVLRVTTDNLAVTSVASSVTVFVSGGTANPSDYTLAGTITIPAGTAHNALLSIASGISVTGDAIFESDETLQLTLIAPVSATLGAQTMHTHTIFNDDTAPTLVINDVSIAEGNGGPTLLNFTVTRSGLTELAAGFAATTADSTATLADLDYAALGTAFSIPAGGATGTATVAVTINGDTQAESNEQFFVNLTAPVNATVSDPQGIGTITNDDAGPTLSINDVSISEGNAGPQVLSFTVTRTGATASTVGFNYASVDNTASIADNDYAAASGSGSIPPGGATGTTTISVSINGDGVFENAESFFVNLSAPTNATIADPQGIGTITNDDTAPTLAINDVSITEGNSGTQNLAFTVTRSGLTALPASFTAATADGSASAPADYLAALAGSTSIAAGGATGTTTLTATINGDFVDELNETFFVNLSAPVNASVFDNQGSGTITDDDTAGISVVHSGGSTNVTEGGATDTYTLVLTSQPTGNVSIALNGGTQVTPSPTPLLFTSGNWNLPQTVTVTAVDDPVIEGNHPGSIASVVTSSDSNYNGFIVAPLSVAITDNDTPGVTIFESGGNTLVTEGAATDTYIMVLTSQPSANVTVTPNGGTQLTSPAAVVFTNGNWNLPQTVTVTATDDNVVEGTHSGTMSHSVASADSNYAGLSVAQVTASITDNDSAVVAFNPVTVGQTEAASPMVFTVTLSNPVASGVSLSLNSAFGTATAADFTPIVAGTISFPSNSSASQTVNVVINNDALDENDEPFTLTLSGLTATGNVTLGTAFATGTIQDDDLPPVIAVTSPSQLEGNAGTTPMNFVVSLSTQSGRSVTFTRATQDGTATSIGPNADFTPLVSGQVTIPEGQLNVTVPVSINGDGVFEGNESFSLNLTAIDGATPTSLSGTGTIVEDDQQPTTTTIASDLPDPSVTGQSYAVNVTVTAQTTSPVGTVNVSDGASACLITLGAGMAPNSSGICNLISITAGNKVLTATYTPASTAFAASSDTEAHVVSAAATSLSVSGPPRSRINQPTSFSFALSVNAPGGGVPTGTVTLSSGASSCTATLPATSCALSFNSLGSRMVSASYAGNASYNASNSSGPGNMQTLVFALSDIVVTKSDAVSTYRPGDLIVYTVTVRNLGPDAAAQIRVRDSVPTGLINVTWSCDASGGVSCPQSGGTGNLDVTIAGFANGGLLNFTFFGNVDASPLQLVNTALVELPADTTIEDPVPANNSATDTDLLDYLFRNGFETVSVRAATGSFTLPSTALRTSLNEIAMSVFVLDDASGEALRVYARVFDGQLQYVLAQRDSSGYLRLSAWASYNDEPTLNWTANQVGDGWLLQSAVLR